MSKDKNKQEKSDVSLENQENMQNKNDAQCDNPAKIDELINDLKRVQADFENYKKRCEKENARFREYVTANFTKKLLPVLDAFEVALKSTQNKEDFVKGIELIFSQFFSILKEEGLSKIDTKEKLFDPYFHEVLLSEKSEKEDELILEEFQKGYMFKEAVLRHAKVKIAKKD